VVFHAPSFALTRLIPTPPVDSVVLISTSPSPMTDG
jgi:hypothetical protein